MQNPSGIRSRYFNVKCVWYLPCVLDSDLDMYNVNMPPLRAPVIPPKGIYARGALSYSNPYISEND